MSLPVWSASRDGDVRYRFSLCCSRTNNHTTTVLWSTYWWLSMACFPLSRGAEGGDGEGEARWITGAHWAWARFAAGDGPLPPTRLTGWGRGRDGGCVTSRVHCSPTGARLQIPPPQHCPGPPLSTLQAVAVGFFFCLPTAQVPTNGVFATLVEPTPCSQLVGCRGEEAQTCRPPPDLPPPTPAEPGSFAGLVLAQRDQGLSFITKVGGRKKKKKKDVHTEE